MQELAFKRFEAGHGLEEETAERPDVRLGGVRDALKDLGGHVAGGADGGAGDVFRSVEGARNAEVADLDLVSGPGRSGSRGGSSA